VRSPKLIVLAVVLLGAALAVGLVVGQQEATPQLAPYQTHFLALWDEVIEGLKASHWGVTKPADVKAMIDAGVDFYLLDVRTDGEWNGGCIPGAHHIALSTLMEPESIAKLPADPETLIVTYCKGGTRGDFALVALRHLGYANSQNISGGYTAWVDAGYPVSTPEEGSDVCP